jgi:hypothetical protein
MRFLTCALVAFAVAGCTRVTQISGPDGKPAYSLNCGANRAGCLQKAGEMCPAGYTVLDSAQGMVAVNGLMAPKNEITVSCK